MLLIKAKSFRAVAAVVEIRVELHEFHSFAIDASMAGNHALDPTAQFPAPARSLRRNDSAQRVTPRKHNAAMIDFRFRPDWLTGLRQSFPLDQRPSAGRAPV